MKFSFFKLIYLILLKPQVFSHLRKHTWWQALRPLLGLIIICSMALGYNDWKENKQAAVGWSNWLFDTQIDALEVAENKLIYTTKETVPYTTTHEGIRFLFTKDGDQFRPQRSDLAEGENIWVSPSKIEHIFRTDSETDSKSFYDKGKLLPVHPFEAFATKMHPQKSVTKAQLLESFNSQLRPYFYGMCFFIVLAVAWLGATFLASTQLVFLSPVFKGMTPSQVVAIHYYCAVPALVIATIFDLLPINDEFLSFGETFLFSLFFYLLLIAGPHIRSAAQIAKDIKEKKKKAGRH